MKTTRGYEICLRLTAEQADKLCADAKKCGLTKTDYLRRLICGKRIRASRSAEVHKLIAEINKIGSNVNQVARAANMGQLTREMADRLLLMLSGIYQFMERIQEQ